MLAQKTRKSRLSESELWDDDHLSQFQSHGSDFTTKVGEVVFVAFADFLDDAMHPQTFEQTRHLADRDHVCARACGQWPDDLPPIAQQKNALAGVK
jgi:hypothetical protein